MRNDQVSSIDSVGKASSAGARLSEWPVREGPSDAHWRPAIDLKHHQSDIIIYIKYHLKTHNTEKN
jgi:hypothetical protein